MTAVRNFRSDSYVKNTLPNDMGSHYELQQEDLNFLDEFNLTHVCNSVTNKIYFSQNTKLSESQLEQAIQQLELRHHYDKYVAFKPGEGIDPGRNFQRQWEMLFAQPLVHPTTTEVITYWQGRTEKLERPLLRVFMRALENDSRTQIAFRPTKPYKQKRLKRLGMPLQEYESIEKKLRNENLIALHSVKMIVHRESMKKDLLAIQRLQWLSMDEEQENIIEEYPIEIICQKTRQLQDKSKELTRQLKEFGFEQKQKLPSSPLTATKMKNDQNIIVLPPAHSRYKDCSIQDCQFNQFQSLSATYLTSQLMDVMTDQFAMMKWKGCQVEWPENPMVLRNNCLDEDNQDTLVIKPKYLMGLYIVGNQMIIGADQRTTIIKEQDTQKNKKMKKCVSVTFVDPKMNRLSIADGVKVDYDHFVHHSLQHLASGQREVEVMKKVYKRNRLELLRQERLVKLKLLKKKRTDELLKRRKNILKIRLKLEDLVIKKQPTETPRTPTHRATKSVLGSANRIILRKFDFDHEQTLNLMKLSCIQQSPSKFKLVCKVESPSTLKLHLGQESHESGSIETHPRNIFNLSASKPIDDFNTKHETM